MKGTLLIGNLPRIVAPVARNLYARGVPVHGACTGTEARPIRSNVFRSYLRLPGRSDGSEKLFTALTRAIEERDIDTVIPCDDEVLLALAPYDEELRRIVHYCAPEREACRRILEKSETLAIAAAAGVPTPAEYRFESESSLDAAAADIRFPLIVKPRNKDIEALTQIKSQIVASVDELRTYFRRHPEFGNWFLFQEFVPGHGVGIEILMDQDEPVVVFQHSRLREYPAAGGVSVAAVSEPPEPVLMKHATALLRAMRWSGVAMVEFRRDSATGRLALMEVNGRFWGSIALPLHCGVEFPWYVWQLAHGIRPTPPSNYPAGVRFRWLAGDIRRVYQALTSGPRDLLTAGTAFARDSVRGSKDSLWSPADPGPALEEAVRAVGAVGLMAAGATMRHVVPPAVHRKARALRRGGLQGALRYFRLRYFEGIAPITQLPQTVRSLAFICHGNLIRSPMAAALVQASGKELTVLSAGTAAVPGREADARAIEAAREFGVSLAGHTAKRVDEQIAASDLLVVMDYMIYASLVEEFPGARAKTVLLGFDHGRPIEIDDPYDGGIEDVRASFEMIQTSIRALLRRLPSPG